MRLSRAGFLNWLAMVGVMWAAWAMFGCARCNPCPEPCAAPVEAPVVTQPKAKVVEVTPAARAPDD